MVLTQFESLPRAEQKGFLTSLTQNSLQDFVFEIEAKNFWFQSKPDWYPGFTAHAARRLSRLAKVIQCRIDAGLAKPETNQLGSIIKREKCISTDLFFKVYLSGKTDLEMIYQDGYSVAAAVKSELKLYSYCEGDVVVKTCPSEAIFKSELISAFAFYAEEY